MKIRPIQLTLEDLDEAMEPIGVTRCNKKDYPTQYWSPTLPEGINKVHLFFSPKSDWSVLSISTGTKRDVYVSNVLRRLADLFESREI